MSEKKSIEFTPGEFSALAFAIKNRMALIEMRALSEYGETPESFKKYLDGEWEYQALRSVFSKFGMD
jgi:hypothetical protein